ncbi:MAG: SpoIIE family protein phosphatase [Phycisphaeraceae bacterium]
MSSSEPTVQSQDRDRAAQDCADAGSASTPAAPPLGLTDFLDVASLQDVQDSFSALTRLLTTIHDADGAPVTAPTDAAHRAQSDAWLEQLITDEDTDGHRFTAPIIVEGQALGSITIEPETAGDGQRGAFDPQARDQFIAATKKLGLDDAQSRKLADAAEDAFAPSRASSIQFLYLLANNIARLCYQEYHARQRIKELSALHKVSTLVSAQRDLKQVLDTAARSVTEVMNVKGAMIRLIDRQRNNELVARAIHNLSDDYIKKGSIRLDESEIYRTALEGKCAYVEDMATDPRVLFQENARREGLVSMLCAGMIYQGKPIGVIQLFTGEVRRFTRFEINLVHSMTHLLATAIENARLDQARLENQRMLRQLQLAADVQRRLLPAARPHLPPLDIAARYVPSFELGGDFYDFIDLDGHLGIAVGDVVGKGVAASLLMASVRASLRAYAQDLYDLDEVISRVNHALCHDTLDNEFATLWYGVFDPVGLRVTFCNAGHELPLLLRDGEIHPMDTGGMIVGVDPHQRYDKALWDLKPGDALLLYTDGLVDAFNGDGERFGRARIEQALREASDKPANELLNHVIWSMRKFTGTRRSLDDTTLVAMRVDE